MGDTYNNILIDNTNIDENSNKDTNITIIDVNNINLVENDFKNIDYVRIFGKGNTFQDVKKTSEKEFNIGINQTVNELTDCDMLVINDLHNIYLIKDEVFKKIKYILTPEYLHIKLKFNIEGHFQKVYGYIKEKGFVGKYIVYNLKSNPNLNKNYIDRQFFYKKYYHILNHDGRSLFFLVTLLINKLYYIKLLIELGIWYFLILHILLNYIKYHPFYQ
jgi:hypothetical protein